MAVTSGSYTVGSGGDYPTWGGAAGATANIGNLTGNLTFTQITATTETARALILSKNVGNFALTFDSDTPHNGDPTGGLITSYNYGGSEGFYTSALVFGTGHVIWKNLYQKAIGGSNLNNFISFEQASGNGRFYIEDILMDGNNKVTAAVKSFNVGASSFVKIKNVNVWDSANFSFELQSCAGTATLENCNAYNGTTGYYHFGKAHVLNNCTGDSNSNEDFASVNLSTGNNNSSGDASAANANWNAGANNIINQVTANCVESTSDTNSDFFNITESGPWDGTGTTNTLTRPYGIRGNVVPGPNGTSIGVAELETIPTGVVAIDNTVPEVSASGEFGFFSTGAIAGVAPEVSASGAHGTTSTIAIDNPVQTVSLLGYVPVTSTGTIDSTIPEISALASFSVLEVESLTSTITKEVSLTSTL